MNFRSNVLDRTPGRDYLRLLSHGAIFSDIVNAALETGIFSNLTEKPRQAQQIAADLGLNPDATRRILNVLGGLDLCARNGDQYSSNNHSQLMADESVSGMGHQMRMFSGPEQRKAWSNLCYSIRTGKTAFDSAYGQTLFQFLDANEEASLRFNKCWQSVTSQVGEEIATQYALEGVQCIVDIGGNRGEMLIPILKKHPTLQAILYDLPAGLAGAGEDLASGGVAERVKIISGDASINVPTGADCAFLKSTIHVCNDEKAIKILTQVAKALPKGSQVIVVERILTEAHEFQWADVVDLTMLAITGGRERTINDYIRLFKLCGLAYLRSVDLPSGFSLLIAEVG